MCKLSVIIPVYNQENLIIKALESIPNDVEIIVVDDCSTDDTFNKVISYIEKSSQNIVLLHNLENKGVGYSVNKGIDNASGEYIVLLGSDDYFVDLDNSIKDLDGTDLIYFDLRINDGSVFHLSQETKHRYCGSTKFIRREFIGDTREPELRAREDYYFYNELLKKNPTEKFLNRVVKHYNYPRYGSLTDLAIKGKIDV